MCVNIVGENQRVENGGRVMDTDRMLREHLLKLMKGGEAHITLEDIVADFPLARIGDRVSNIPYSPWEVLEHIRIAQWDILEFSRNSQHVSPKWPKGYWPDPQKTPTEDDWSRTLAEIASDKTLI